MKNEITKEYCAKHFARGQCDVILHTLTGIQKYMEYADSLDDETKSQLDDLETILLKLKTRLE